MCDACRTGRFAKNISTSLVKLAKIGLEMGQNELGSEKGWTECVGGESEMRGVCVGSNELGNSSQVTADVPR
jgi:hypothetical protein